ncbi:ABC transporter substrate-binding protein [Pseudaminobacter arsenicus]|uniref:ABC transporter substrate-binding protein n=1 Tax=Borborobacter arsenicus TaxID=1851146 RepID=A0A432V0B5_9HYPH|nr:substrate-binding domain-containing protein [Pseudaminobacter arsenicus]RUM95619.1 ABC transporter substrate-binding protein [Pseudaminobacter arsenicus]
MPDALKVMSTLAVALALKRSILFAWEASGRKVDMQWNPTGVLVERVRGGERADVIISIDEPTLALAGEGVLSVSTIRPLARAGFGLAVRAGAPRPDISSPETFKAALLASRAIAYSLTGASGLHLQEVARALGIADEVEARAVTIPAGFTAEKLISGEADLAVQQISELMSVEGVDIVGPFPAVWQKHTDFSAAAFCEARRPAEALAFIDHLASPASMQAYANAGLAPRAAGTSS